MVSESFSPSVRRAAMRLFADAQGVCELLLLRVDRHLNRQRADGVLVIPAQRSPAPFHGARGSSASFPQLR